METEADYIWLDEKNGYQESKVYCVQSSGDCSTCAENTEGMGYISGEYDCRGYANK